MKTTYYVIGRGLAGWHATGKGVSSSGGSLYPQKWHAGGMTTGYLEQAAEGALVYDASEADERSFYKLVISGPMVDPSLGPDEVNRFTTKDRDAMTQMLPGLQGGFKTLATLALDQNYGGLDKVGVNIYYTLLKQVSGMRLGHVRGGKVEWEP
jgi:hypothetical protein